MKVMESLQVIPIHDCQDFARECCDLINSEWPRSTAARLQSLNVSSESFPASLVLILNESQVVGHVKLSELRYRGPEIMLESMIIHRDHRHKGWGKILMSGAEKYVERRGKTKIFLSTRGQEGFYKKLGYETCQPISYFGFCDLTPKGEEKVEFENNNNNARENKIQEIDSSVPVPPPPPPLPKNNNVTPQVYKTSKTFLFKYLKSYIKES